MRTPRRPASLNFCSHLTYAGSPINACPAALSTIKCPGKIAGDPVAHAASSSDWPLQVAALQTDSSSTVCRNVNPEKTAGGLLRTLTLPMTLLLQRKHMFFLRSRARRSFGVPSPSMEADDRRVDCRSCREPFARFRAVVRDEKNPRSFRAAFLSSWAWAQVR